MVFGEPFSVDFESNEFKVSGRVFVLDFSSDFVLVFSNMCSQSGFVCVRVFNFDLPNQHIFDMGGLIVKVLICDWCCCCFKLNVRIIFMGELSIVKYGWFTEGGESGDE